LLALRLSHFGHQCRHRISTAGDGLGDDGLLEVKCPSAHTHFDRVVGGAPMSAAYRTQVTHGLWLTGRAWADLVTFNPDFGPRLRVQITQLYAKDLDLVSYDRRVRACLADVDAAFARVPRVAPGPVLVRKR
jgi:hypothetical protein